MNRENKLYFVALSILIGAGIGAGVLGIPYVAAQAGFLISFFYILFIGGIVLLINLYLGEVALRTKGNHQLSGYAEKYLGKKAKTLMRAAFAFGIYASLVAYLIGVGESLSFLIFGSLNYSIQFGIIFSFFMMFLLWKGVKALKSFEKFGVAIILGLLILIFFLFIGEVSVQNLNYVNWKNIFLPFGVILFAFLSFSVIPEVAYILRKDKKIFKKVIITSSIVSIIFYLLFAFVVVGFKGLGTPEVATLALGPIFIFLGIFTMFTSHLSLGNALEEDFEFDAKLKKKSSWFLASIVPILIYSLISFFDFFSFTKVLSIGGVVSGGIVIILTLFIVKKAKKSGKREPEFSIPLNWPIIIFIILIFVFGIVRELWSLISNF